MGEDYDGVRAVLGGVQVREVTTLQSRLLVCGQLQAERAGQQLGRQ